MIVYQNKDSFVMTEQNKHATLSGQLSSYWAFDDFSNDPLRDTVIFAIKEHDRSWISLDDSPVWNEQMGIPYSFTDFPLEPKLKAYKFGIDQVEHMNEYAALLDSLHYSSFSHIRHSSEAAVFRENESSRQKRIKHRLRIEGDQLERLNFHLRLLQFFDEVSLYICLQEPGIPKERGISWFKNGFDYEFSFATEEKIVPSWLDHSTVRLSPFPLLHEVAVSIDTKIISKSTIEQIGLLRAYQNEQYTERRVTFVP